jgi:hypothetical protein
MAQTAARLQSGDSRNHWFRQSWRGGAMKDEFLIGRVSCASIVACPAKGLEAPRSSTLKAISCSSSAMNGNSHSSRNNERKVSMTIKALVLSDRPDEYTGKKGLVKQQVINVIDQEVGHNRLTQPLEYAMSEDEKPKYAGKLQDKSIKLGIREIVPFGGRLRVRGQIVEVEGLK